MSLHARIAIGASRRAIALEHLAMIGGLGLATATAFARSASPIVLVIGVVIVGTLAVVGLRSLRAARRDALLVLDASVRVELHGSGPRPVAHLEVAEGSLAWPGLTVLRLVPAPMSSAQARRVVAFDGDLDKADLRGLRRHLLWVSRGGARPDPAIDRSS